jgi:hypothetical protein
LYANLQQTLPQVSHRLPQTFMQFTQNRAILCMSDDRRGRSRLKEMKYMTKENNKKRMKKGVAFTALFLAATLPLVSMAEASQNQITEAAGSADTAVTAQALGRGRFDRFPDGYTVDVSQLTDEQKAVYDSAVALYEQVEDAVLTDLAKANIVTQTDVDDYIALRSAQKSLNELDQTNWTAEQYKAYYEAKLKTGDERKAAMQALADAGQLTKDQASALSAQGETGLWAKIAQNAGTNSAIQTAISTMRQALATLNSTLRGAGIEGMGNGRMFDSFNNGAGKHMQNFGKNEMPSRPQGGMGGRK